MKLDILAIGVHPDDVELSCAGTLLSHIDQGHTAGIVDLTMGQLGSRGTPELRLQEADAAAKVLGIDHRVNLRMEDGWFQNDQASKIKIIEQIRHFRPEIVLANAVTDRHPDHGRASQLISEACFYSGLRKIETSWDGKAQDHWRPKVVYHYIQDRSLKADIVVDITPYFEQKMKSVLAYKSQFYDPNSKEPETPISGEDFLNLLKAKGHIYGRDIGVKYAEGFTVERTPGVKNLLELL